MSSPAKRRKARLSRAATKFQREQRKLNQIKDAARNVLPDWFKGPTDLKDITPLKRISA